MQIHWIPADRSVTPLDGHTAVWKGLVAGAAGGLAGAFAVSLFMAVLKTARREPGAFGRQLRLQLRRGGQTARESPSEVAPTVRAARIISERVFGHRLPARSETPAGAAVHLGFGAGTGACYGAAAEVAPRVTAGGGVPFGLAVWLGADETLLPLLGLSKPSTRIDLTVHGASFAAHIVYGATTEIVRRAVRRWL